MNSWKKLIRWSKSEHSDLPWRKNRTLYRTLVSEIMLQQTTVGTVVNHFDRFLKLYPNLKTLAASTEEEVCMAWKGLGYYRRARNLRKAAIDIQELYKGRIPLDKEKLLKINGVGEYTASALLSIGGERPALAVDANLERVLSRLFAIDGKKGPALQKAIARLYESGEILSDLEKLGPREVNEALMDLGRIYCQARKTSCSLCPMNSNCKALEQGDPLKFPIGGNEKKITKNYELDLLRVVVKKGKRVMAYQKGEDEWLSGQLELPTFIMRSDDKKIKQYPKCPKITYQESDLTMFKTGITKYKIKNFILKMTEKDFRSMTKSKRYQFYDSDLKKSNYSTSTIKVFKKLEEL